MTTPDGYVDIEVEISDEQVAHLIMAGMAEKAEDGVLVLTPAGSAWLKSWCDEQLAKHKA